MQHACIHAQKPIAYIGNPTFRAISINALRQRVSRKLQDKDVTGSIVLLYIKTRVEKLQHKIV